MRAALSCTVLVVGAGCDGGPTEGGRATPIAITEAIAPHRERFGHFDRWARRTLAAPMVPSRRDATRETLFSELRRDDVVLAAFVDEAGARTTRFSHPPRAAFPDVPTWGEARIEDLGVVRAAYLAGPPRWVFSRTAPLDDGTPLTVTLLVSAEPAGAGR